METLNELKIKNPQYKIQNIEDASFKRYGMCYTCYALAEIKQYFQKKAKLPAQGNEYNPSNSDLEKMGTIQQIERDVFAGMAVNVGECVGRTTSFSAVEFHQGSEVNIMLTDVVMVFGKRSEIKNGTFNAEKDAQLFFVPAGSVIEIFSDTLHYSPIMVRSPGFKVVVMVLKGTNQPLEKSFKSNNPWIVKKNKFQAAHFVRKDKLASGVVQGVSGKLIKLKALDIN
ncbi:DUF4867 family protein [Liquorilactobacillus satsumensis]|uniref:DUF4867 domain-containing protein n=1 Tax=Liquorilactobacillus satsumensis DSM 16230 = JCM 12392 TaxID=1423801 RepID=A0A0R1V6J7_9LACO|nr:DUF4867 family protein [Liquorilactobacillus satsumensis]KRL99016.1 hypothetical protein FD50_GL000285 [Liquorilactobacillus satsumensis DSM 16230 = JCM 12392]MCC7666909.1 DUF4867 domain-containing protein [Liquorilactobacillus satsumensis]MCP9357191.1 DUF4867 family protein [Liquorilactobacillus satsumensis]MCP9371138.1 DUF4867 family protein [Liquorilactobacillus satsumensis]